MKISRGSLEHRWKFPGVHLLAVVLAFVAVLSLIFAVGQVLSLLNGRTEAEAAFTNSAELPDELLDAVSWTEDTPGLPREMDPLTREAVTISWLRAWEQLAIVSQTGETVGVEVYFSNDSRTAVLAGSPTWNDRTIDQLGHELTLTFFSEDGQVLAMDSSSLVQRGVDDLPEATVDLRENYEVVMLLEDGNWRVQHMVRRSIEPVELGADDQDSEPEE